MSGCDSASFLSIVFSAQDLGAFSCGIEKERKKKKKKKEEKKEEDKNEIDPVLSFLY